MKNLHLMAQAMALAVAAGSSPIPYPRVAYGPAQPNPFRAPGRRGERDRSAAASDEYMAAADAKRARRRKSRGGAA